MTTQYVATGQHSFLLLFWVVVMSSIFSTGLASAQILAEEPYRVSLPTFGATSLCLFNISLHI